MLDIDDTPEEERHEASSYPTRLVWLLSFLALYTTFIMVTIVWWTLVDVRSEREKLAGQQSEINTLRNKLEGRIENEKWEIASFLDADAPQQPTDRFILPALIKSYQESVNDQTQQPMFESLSSIGTELSSLHTSSQLWSERFHGTMTRLPDLRGEVGFILARLDQAVTTKAAHAKQGRAERIKTLLAATPASSSGLASAVIDEVNAAPDLTDTIRDIYELSLLRVKIQHEEDPGALKRLRDEAIRPVLARLVEQKNQPPEKRVVPSELVDELAIALFGIGHRIDNEQHTIITGQGNFLYENCAERVILSRERELLREQMLDTTRRAHEIVQQIAERSETFLKQEGSTVESAIRRALHIILIVGIATAAIFLAISYKIISEIKGQIRAIEESNKMLDNRTKALVKSEDALRKSEERLQYLSSNLLTAQEKERRRIAHELHDELGQSMAALKMQVSAIERKAPNLSADAVREECHSIRDHINEIIENVRRLSRDLSPVVIDDLGLEAAIEYLVTNFAHLHTMAVTVDLPDINPLFSQDAQRLIYRIIQEALTNVSKHAKASHITILAEHKGDLVSFMVHDDGVGFDLDGVIDQDSTTKGMGLTTMAERVRILGGSIDFRSRPGLGTSITFTAPIYRRVVPESV